MWDMFVIDYYSAIKENENLPFATTWMNLEGIMLTEISQTEKDKYYVLSHIWNLKKKKKNEYKKTDTNSDTEN